MSRKRKSTRRGSPDYNTGGDIVEKSFPYSSKPIPFIVQGHEATITRDRPDLVQSLTAHDLGNGKCKGGLIQWHGERLTQGQEVWVDRYDARLLLTSLPITSGSNNPPHTTPSPTGWSDLPSDSEDTFFFSPAEIEDLHRQKRRKLMDAGREARLRAIQQSDPNPARDFVEAMELWGGDEEEPDDAQRMLMERTAKHLLTSPNSGQLEMRILANHGSDQRFAFLRGRWRNAWQTIKLLAKEKIKLESHSVAGTTASGSLVAYGDSDDSDKRSEEPDQPTLVLPEPVQAENAVLKEVDETEKEARRARAREWIKQRKAGKDDEASLGSKHKDPTVDYDD